MTQPITILDNPVCQGYRPLQPGEVILLTDEAYLYHDDTEASVRWTPVSQWQEAPTLVTKDLPPIQRKLFPGQSLPPKGRIPPGWYWVQHKHWTATKGKWLMCCVNFRKTFRGQDCTLFISEDSRQYVTTEDITAITPVQPPLKS